MQGEHEHKWVLGKILFQPIKGFWEAIWFCAKCGEIKFQQLYEKPPLADEEKI